ncbi:MAG TPA: UvrD-helicase domain-containing protein [Desulfuromonadales bacterium]|nr:UvrD-helicase domain-containing protein [Desulfuromonadales bacterium]
MNTLSDAAVRALALDPERSFIVQAPAGSGKTELLTQRLLALLARVRRPDEILAITFTRKAATEMRHRLLQALARAQGEEPEPEHERRTWRLANEVLKRDRECGWQLLNNPSLLGIQTIDSFNSSLVRRMPWLSRFGGMPQIAENPSRLYREAARRTLARVGSRNAGGAQTARLLTHLDNRMELLEAMLINMLQRRDQWLRHLVGADPGARRHLLEDALASYLTALLLQARARLPEELAEPLLVVARYAAGNLADERPLAVLGSLQRVPGTTSGDLPIWQGLADLLLTSAGDLRRRVDKNCGFPAGKHGPEAAMKEAMQALLADPSLAALAPLLAEIRRLPPPDYSDDQWQVLQALIDLLLLAARELWLVFREEAEVDFSEVAGQALRALREEGAPSELLLRLDTRLSHILVDEFQDTSWLQFELLARLTEGWQPGDGRTLFVVGDPMQSIYRFREAEVGLFLRAQRYGIGTVPLEPLVLSANFRSRAGIVEWVNESFSRVFPGTEDMACGAVRYAPATAVHPPGDGPAVCCHPQAGRDDAGEAQRVVDLIREALGRGDASIAILVRSRPHLAHILPALRQAGLRYLAQEIDPLAERPVARDLVSLTRALLHPGDRLAWLAVLRAPWCGLPLNDLHALCRGERQATLPALLADPQVLGRLTPDGQKRAARSFAVLQEGRRQRGRVGLRRLVEGCWLSLGGPACCDAAALEDAQRVFGLLEELERGGDLVSLDQLEEGLQRLFAASDAAAGNRLQIMTIHKAKGLEFDTVILPGLGRRARPADKPLLRWLEHPECGLLLAPVEPRGENSRDPIYDMIGRLEKEKAELEVTRLLYVAATRAKNRLHLLGHVTHNQNGEARPEAGSLLDKLWPAVSEAFVPEAPGEPATIAAESFPPALPLRRLPADWKLPTLVAAPVKYAAVAGRASAVRQMPADEAGFSGRNGDLGRHIGTVVHYWLERIARDGLASWPRERLDQMELPIRRQLIALGVAATWFPDSTGKIRRALQAVLDSQRGRWLLAAHLEAASEYPLAGMLDGELVHAVLDRTFVDAEGTRWVIDYKTGLPLKNEDHAVFYQRERECYQEQLARYAALFRSLEPDRAVRTALYFPMFDGWYELPLEDHGKEGNIECKAGDQ